MRPAVVVVVAVAVEDENFHYCVVDNVVVLKVVAPGAPL